MHTRIAVSAAVVAVLAAHPGTAAAQAPPTPRDSAPAPAFTDTGGVTLRGIVQDTAGRPLLGAQVSAVGQLAITEADGRFELRDVRADTIHLFVRRIGHQPAAISLAPPGGLIVDFAVTLVPNVVELGTIVIEGRTLDRRLWSEGFYERAKLGFGTSFGPEELGRHSSIETALRMVPSVRVSRTADGRVVALGPAMAGSVCPLTVYVDGVLVRWADEVGLNALVGPGEVLAMEVYPRATQVPATLRPAGPVGGGGGIPSPGSGAVSGGPVDCGALAVWTRPPGDPR